jgi:cell division septum initiation protein DivIVA
MKDRVNLTLNGMKAPNITDTEPPLVAPDSSLPNQALHVLTLAQRTADEHVQSAHRHADKIRAEALAAAEQIVHDADVHAQNVRREADKVLAQGRATAEDAAREAETCVAEAQRTADTIVAKARTQAEAVAANAEQHAAELELQAQRRYDDVVGSLAARREALQSQIEALERFDHEYRARLTTFMQGQLRALWVDQPQMTDELEMPDESVPPEQEDSGAPNAAIPAPRQSAEPATDPAPALSEN